jgi:hypothetical protein
MCGKGMTEGVRGSGFIHARRTGGLADSLLHNSNIQVVTFCAF